MQVHTLIQIDSHPTPVQIGEPFHCWECGSLDLGGKLLIINHSPLEAYVDHIYYMRLACGHNPRCVRLGDAITPLPPLDQTVDRNLACVRDGLAELAKAVPPDQQHQEPVAKIVYLLIAGRISPQTAINRLRDQVQPDQPILLTKLPVDKQTWR